MLSLTSQLFVVKQKYNNDNNRTLNTHNKELSKLLNAMAHRPNETGYLVLNEDGAVFSSAGDLENDEKTAEIIMGLVKLSSQIDSTAFPSDTGFNKLSITYANHCYIGNLSNRKIYISKQTIPASTAETTSTPSTEVESI